MKLIESDSFPIEFLSRLAERESWRKEIHRPIYHIHKWWAKRLGSVFRGILLGCVLSERDDLAAEFYRFQDFRGLKVFDPFLGSGTTVGEAHKLGLTAFGRDINPVAVSSTRVAFGPLDREALRSAFAELSSGVGRELRSLYRSEDSRGRPCEVLYYFWVMQAPCPHCRADVDLFSSWVIARNAYPSRKPEVQLLCPGCGDIFPGIHGEETATCRRCSLVFRPADAPVRGSRARCLGCGGSFAVAKSAGISGSRPGFRMYGKLVLSADGSKQYLPATGQDRKLYEDCGSELDRELAAGTIQIPSLELEDGHNTRQAIGYGFTNWRDFFNDRQLLALGRLRRAIAEVGDPSSRDALLVLFSGVLEFNNLFASYKGEGTGAVRHMFSHHILKPERSPIEANVWGTPRSSGSFSNLFRGRIMRALDYREAPTEVGPGRAKARVCSAPFSGEAGFDRPGAEPAAPRSIRLSCGDSSETDFPDRSMDLVVTDPPFFDNVHYSELADFFHAWQQLIPDGDARRPPTTRSTSEVQDSDPDRFSTKLQGVFRECRRLLKDDGLLVFSYHHSRKEGWSSLASAILNSGFVVVNAHPVKAEMSGATPKSQARDPIQLDIILVCRKNTPSSDGLVSAKSGPIEAAVAKVGRLREAGLSLSNSDIRIIIQGQLMTTIRSPSEAARLEEVTSGWIEDEAIRSLAATEPLRQLELF